MLSFGLWVYIILRAIYSPFVFDEATTFLLYVHNNKIIPGDAYLSANNHVLNTALTWVSYNLLGPEEWHLRLPNVLAFPVFCHFLFKISLNLKSNWSRILLVLGVLSGHIFLEMFGFSRGYGLSFAALAGAIYYGLINISEDRLKNRVGLYLSNFLMLSANLTLLPISLALAALTFNYTLWNGRSKNQLSRNIIFFGVPIVIAACLSFQLKAEGMLYYAAETGFWEGSIKSVLNAFWYSDGYLQQSLFIGYFLIVVVLLWLSFINKILNKTTVFIVLLLATPFVFYPLAKLFFNVEYPLDRALLYLPFLLLLALAFSMDSSKGSHAVKVLLTALVSIPLMVSFASNVSLKKATGFRWNTEQISDSFFEEVSNRQATVGGYFLRQKCWEYLNIKSETKENVLQISDFPGMTADYQVVNAYDFRHFDKNYRVVLENDASELLLLKRKVHLEKSELIHGSEKVVLTNAPGFTKLQELNIDSISNPLLIEFSGLLKSDAKPFDGLLAISVLGKNGEQLLYEEVKLRNLYLDYSEQKEVSQSIYFPNYGEADILNVLFWNKDDQDFEMTDFGTKVITLKTEN